MMNHTLLFKNILISICMAVSISACSINPQQSNILKIAQQGNFAAGGKVIQTAGQFDDVQLFNPQGQTLHGDHTSCFIKFLNMPDLTH